jgi:DNA-binding CsgD family transcriptional regulator
VFPLRRGHAIRGMSSAAEAVLLVDDPHENAKPAQADLYSRAFRLTPAEARLAVHLANGTSLTEVSDMLGVTYNTVRAQLRSIFDKTDTHRQAELVGLLQTSRSLRISLS